MSRRARGKTGPGRGRKALRNLLIVMAAISLLQYTSKGEVTWPVDAYHKVVTTLGDYATRPAAGWRRASDKLEKMGAAREGHPTPDFDLSGRVVRVADGDTVSILDSSKTQHKVRLYGIDTPERDQPYGKAAKRVLSTLVSGKTVGVVVVETDDYGRTVGTVYLQDKNINVAMIESGHAWWYRHYAPHNRLLAATEQQAREQGLGLWSERSPVPPWDWRRGRR